MSARTPGPWHAVTIGTQSFVAQRADSEASFALAAVFFPTYHPDGLAAARAEQAGNTALIAAAPDMAGLLTEILHGGAKSDDPYLWDRIAATLTKAGVL